ncbi:hypothetical protein ULMS_21100 [Patiriisocius marinistellae]|uniref:Lipoprotein n=1 Tax=Patiriisocius marinistellae TaxID=2494560 RepID=A0A5J4FZD1_9FLAO|nr:hypothetical protein [Patiriisocius marinistellae]GEQ86602.1 hypothetical protein ULMS_21100 [Patiriisocius marinistellae]
MKDLKQTIIGAIAIFLFATLFSSCGLFSEEPTGDSNDETPPEYVNEPAKIISIKQAKNMYDIYTERKVPALMWGADNPELNQNSDGTNTTDPNFKPTRYIEYSLEEIKHYISYIESEADLAGAKVGNLRIYLGAYPIKGDVFESGEVARYNRQESIFILPTTKNPANGMQQGFYTSGSANGGKREPVFLINGVEELNKKDGKVNRKGNRIGKQVSQASMLGFNIAQDNEDRSLILNDGNVVPPPKQNTDMGGSDNDNDSNDNDNDDNNNGKKG